MKELVALKARGFKMSLISRMEIITVLVLQHVACKVPFIDTEHDLCPASSRMGSTLSNCPQILVYVVIT